MAGVEIDASLVIREASHVKREASESGTKYASQALAVSPFTRDIPRQFHV